MRDTVVIFLIAAATAVGILLISMVLAVSAPAQEWAGNTPRWTTQGAKPRPKFKPRRRHRHRDHRETRRVVIVRRVREEPRRAPQCKAVLSVVGDQAATDKGARNQAEKAWQQEVRFRYGERYADARFAGDIRFACVDSSIRNILNRATEAVGLNSQAKHCQMVARPCMAPLEPEGVQ